ncbi:hypothetical protein HYALB_00007864 [Hymenoscyphus albidus]|uniref:Uncharacterized protein n=1 Tax=Hymenoscyphus albidus TaxID=595503 RepID=A0A9N9LH29_9HELO|nr:hypothetical protein HYALB_00007864 [Hymenoscyphus albidus]
MQCKITTGSASSPLGRGNSSGLLKMAGALRWKEAEETSAPARIELNDDLTSQFGLAMETRSSAAFQRYLGLQTTTVLGFVRVLLRNGRFQETEIDNFAATSQFKRFLKAKQMVDRSETESDGEESSEGT